MNLNKIAKYFFTITTSLMGLGVIINFSKNQGDVYQIWVVGAMVVGWVLLEQKNK